MSNPRLLIGLPLIPFEAVSDKLLDFGDLLPASRFTPEGTGLEVFSEQLRGKVPAETWAVNVPIWPLQETKVKGVAGPGHPDDELFWPTSLKKTLGRLCGSYDKWRPYPAQAPLSNYSINMAKRFIRKRGRMFEEIAKEQAWDALIYVEHAPASLIHINEKIAIKVAEPIISLAVKVARECPRTSLAIFSPYGIGKKSGFIVSNIVEGEMLSNWTGIRRFINGEKITK